MIIWLASYPRSGNTLLRIIFRAVFERETYSKHGDETDIAADPQLAAEVGHRTLGASWSEAYAEMRSTGDLHLVKTHDPPEDHGKAIYIVRDGRGACRSFYQYLKDFPAQKTQVSALDVVVGFTPFGSWGDHLDHWDPQRRPNTLLVSYENLMADPAKEIQRIADFTQLNPLHGWQNNFDRLHELNPRFFRTGSSSHAETALDPEANAIFWAQHGDWMRQLNYPQPSVAVDEAAHAFRQWISKKGREHFNLRERVFIAELPHPSEQLAREQEARIQQLRGQLQATHAMRAELQNRLDDAQRLTGAMRKQSAISLQTKERTSELLAAAVIELNTRLRLLLTSRFLRLGWKIGFGSTPYWADTTRDEVTPLLELINRRPGSKSLTNESLRRISDAANRTGAFGGDMQSALHHLVDKGFNPQVVLDIGSAKGYWSVTAAQHWPTAEFFMIDPLRQSEPALQKLCEDARFHYQLVAVGSQPGEAVMNVTPDGDGSSLLEFQNSDPTGWQTVPVDTLDRLLTTGRIKPPQLVKLDVQGFELQALEGGSNLFESAEVFIIEANLYEFMPGCPRLHQLVQFMSDRRYYPFDFAGFLRRPFENDLGQVDIVFVRENSPMVSSNRWVEMDTEADSPAQIQTSGVIPKSAVVEDKEPEKEIAPVFVSVVICTKDPRMDVLDRTLDALEQQSLAKDRFELVVVDNHSSPPLSVEMLRGRRTIQPRIIVEPTPGLTRARCAGIAAARGEVLVFVDDDNFLDGEYLTLALEIFQAKPRIGLAGGISVVEHESPVPKWKGAVLPYLGVRNYGPDPITKFADHWGEWEPIGAGMVARRAVAEKFVQMYRSSADAQLLGRTGNALLSGEDSLFARAAHAIGYSCSYQPALKLVHYLKSSRMRVRYLARLMAGHGRSFVLLNRALGKPTDPLKRRTAIARLLHRLRSTGRAGAITWFWDLGYAAEKRNDRPQGVQHGR